MFNKKKSYDSRLQEFCYFIFYHYSFKEESKVVTSVQHDRITAAIEHTKQVLRNHETVTQEGTSLSTVSCLKDVADNTASITDAGSARVKKEENSQETDTSGKHSSNNCEENESKRIKREGDDDVMSLLSAQSIRERENKRLGEEILELLNRPSARERSVAQHFRSQGGAKVREFCPRGTAEECIKSQGRLDKITSCGKLHFRKIIQPHTDESLGDCSFLNTCFHMDTCRYVHYEVDYSGMEELAESSAEQISSLEGEGSYTFIVFIHYIN